MKSIRRCGINSTFSLQSTTRRFSIIIFLALFLAACTTIQPKVASTLQPSTAVVEQPTETPTSQPTETAASPKAETAPPIPLTLVNFRVQIPPNSPPEDDVYLTILDEVTGLAVNPQIYPMEEEFTEPGASRTFSVTLPLPMNAAIPYRYERAGSTPPVVEHVSDGRPVYYRLYHVEGPGTVQDVVSNWTDTPYISPSGRISGKIVDQESGEPLPNILVSAAGYQTLTRSDGTFLIEGIPPGTHNLVALAMDGSHRTFQQGALVAENSTTPADIKMAASHPVTVMFVVSLPEDTPPTVPIRLAGNLFQLGNVFANLSGGINTLATSMPILTPLSDGRYSLSLTLPAGANVRYKYSLGDGFWNSESTPSGDFNLRQFIVPENNIIIEDKVDSWQKGEFGPIVFDVKVPENTPADDSIFIQFKPIFGWTEPIPMWRLGPNRWAYILYNPLNLPGDLNYRYCRNGQCGAADDIDTAGMIAAGRPIKIRKKLQTINDQVNGWVGLDTPITPSDPASVQASPRGDNFMAAVEMRGSSDPSWRSRWPYTLDNAKELGANWVILSPTWTFTRNSPPVFEQVPGEDMFWFENVEVISEAHSRGLKVALNPKPGFPSGQADWWQSANRDFAWWQNWFEQYRNFALHHADLAARSGVSTLILGGDWIAPALPGGLLADGTPSGVPADAETRWRNLLTEVRNHFTGQLLWAIPYQQISEHPDFLDSVDGIYLLWSSTSPSTDLQAEAVPILDFDVRIPQLVYNKPVILSFFYPSGEDLQGQADAYQAMLSLVAEREWIQGFVSRGFYPPASLQDNSASVNGKPAQTMLGSWYQALTLNPSP